jgi:hypothetical protein
MFGSIDKSYVRVVQIIGPVLDIVLDIVVLDIVFACVPVDWW